MFKECSRSNTINMSLCSQVGHLPFTAAIISEFIFQIMCLSQSSSARTMAWVPIVWQLGGVWSAYCGVLIMEATTFSVPVLSISQLNGALLFSFFFLICSVSFYRAVHLGQWGNGVKVLLYLVSWQKWRWDLLIIFSEWETTCQNNICFIDLF